MNERRPFPLSSNVGRVNIDPRWLKSVKIAAKLDNALQSLTHISRGHHFSQRIVTIVQAVKDLRENIFMIVSLLPADSLNSFAAFRAERIS